MGSGASALNEQLTAASRAEVSAVIAELPPAVQQRLKLNVEFTAFCKARAKLRESLGDAEKKLLTRHAALEPVPPEVELIEQAFCRICRIPVAPKGAASLDGSWHEAFCSVVCKGDSEEERCASFLQACDSFNPVENPVGKAAVLTELAAMSSEVEVELWKTSEVCGQLLHYLQATHRYCSALPWPKAEALSEARAALAEKGGTLQKELAEAPMLVKELYALPRVPPKVAPLEEVLCKMCCVPAQDSWHDAAKAALYKGETQEAQNENFLCALAFKVNSEGDPSTIAALLEAVVKDPELAPEEVMRQSSLYWHVVEWMHAVHAYCTVLASADSEALAAGQGQAEARKLMLQA
eukprot:TRINITY_DN25257_c0_g1_i1.p1 TRINITY_DN25257_c0_g1~~TRINITY_DN25257_c0_g1_i1.p1  ORF type:complete len:352 (-),score=91.31 TRINITY_DN25257_c0_g1_i1:132-1187(-)